MDVPKSRVGKPPPEEDGLGVVNDSQQAQMFAGVSYSDMSSGPVHCLQFFRRLSFTCMLCFPLGRAYMPRTETVPHVFRVRPVHWLVG